MTNTTIIVLTEVESPRWRWIEPLLADTSVKFEFIRCFPSTTFEQALPLTLVQLRGGFQAAWAARRAGAKAAVIHGPRFAVWFGLFSYLFRLKIPIVVYRFNFGSNLLPPESKRKIYRLAFSRCDRFVVSSRMERDLYAKAFFLPFDRFDFLLWALWPPRVEPPDTPLEAGDYVCAVGGNARDYPLLAEAARRLPNLRFVLVVRPENLAGLDLPPNMTTHVNMPLGNTMNILRYSRFMMLPLRSEDKPNGHDTLVAAMHLGKAFIVTDSAGVRDYVSGDSGVTIAAASIDALTTEIERLWNDPALCHRLGENGQLFAQTECVPNRVADHFRNWLRSHGLDISKAKDSL